MIKIIRAKLHGIHVTDANLNYHGSITLDPEYCKIVGIYPMEFVEIWNKNNGKRITTYVIFGNPGSKCCILNGAAARTCQEGDQLIIAASEYCETNQLCNIKPKIMTFTSDNNIDEILEYEVQKESDGSFNFAINKLSNCLTNSV